VCRECVTGARGKGAKPGFCSGMTIRETWLTSMSTAVSYRGFSPYNLATGVVDTAEKLSCIGA
jgi:hypothetical protein